MFTANQLCQVCTGILTDSKRHCTRQKNVIRSNARKITKTISEPKDIGLASNIELYKELIIAEIIKDNPRGGIMCLAVCNKKLGGCGYLGDDQEWVRQGDQYLCPNCHKDRMYFLFDYNVEAVVEGSILKKAKNMLDEYYGKLNGKSYDAPMGAGASLHTV